MTEGFYDIIVLPPVVPEIEKRSYAVSLLSEDG